MNRDADDLRQQVHLMGETLAELTGALERERSMSERLARESLVVAAELKLTREALEPFANAANFYEVESQTDEDAQLLVRRGTGFASALTVRNFRTAQRVIRRQRETGQDRGGGSAT